MSSSPSSIGIIVIYSTNHCKQNPIKTDFYLYLLVKPGQVGFFLTFLPGFWYHIVSGDRGDQEVKKNSSQKAHNQAVTAGSGAPAVLLIGDISGAVTNPRQVAEQGCRACGDIVEAAALARVERFERIFVVLSSLGAHLESSLKALQQASPGSAIILLAQMYEEPIARRLLCSAKSSSMPVDDYLICPVDVKSLTNGTALVKVPPRQTGQVGFGRGDYPEARIRELQRLATEDDLTGLKNRRYVREFLRQIIERAKKEGLRVTLFLFDIDNFKHYNDTYGHNVGDMVLKQAAVMMRRCCRAHDVVGRIGGDEFAVIFWDLPTQVNKNKEVNNKAERRRADAGHPSEALFISERFRSQISSADFSFLGYEGKGVLTVSGGLASFSPDTMTARDLLEQADKAMLKAKRSGKNQIYLVGKPK